MAINFIIRVNGMGEVYVRDFYVCLNVQVCERVWLRVCRIMWAYVDRRNSGVAALIEIGLLFLTNKKHTHVCTNFTLTCAKCKVFQEFIHEWWSEWIRKSNKLFGLLPKYPKIPSKCMPYPQFHVHAILFPINQRWQNRIFWNVWLEYANVRFFK